MTELLYMKASDAVKGQELVAGVKQMMKERNTHRARQMLNEINDIFLNAKQG